MELQVVIVKLKAKMLSNKKQLTYKVTLSSECFQWRVQLWLSHKQVVIFTWSKEREGETLIGGGNWKGQVTWKGHLTWRGYLNRCEKDIVGCQIVKIFIPWEWATRVVSNDVNVCNSIFIPAAVTWQTQA